MGVSWYSEAEVISTEPEVIKQLIEEIAEVWVENEDTRDGTRIKVSEGSEETACVCDLRIEGNSVLFHSSGYGCYGSDPEYRLIDFGRVMLFKCLFDKYDKALVCFEIVQPCQGQSYYFSTSWAKPDGKIVWDEEEDWDYNKNFYIQCNVDDVELSLDFENIEDIEDEFFTEFSTQFGCGIWFVSFQQIDRLKLPNIKKLINLALEAGFTDWLMNSDGIMISDIDFIGDYLNEYPDKYDNKDLESDLIGEARYEAIELCMYGLSDIDIRDAEFEFPADFPEMKSAYAKAYEKKQAEIENEEKLNLKGLNLCIFPKVPEECKFCFSFRELIALLVELPTPEF